MRSFAQILEDEKKNRNILEIYLKNKPNEDPDSPKPRSLTFDDLGELIFDVLKIDPKDCVSFDYNTGRYDTRQIKFKAGVSIDMYVTKEPITFKDHMITTKKQLHNITRVTFRNVPLNVPDEEIIELCNCYGKPVNNQVFYELLSNSKNKGHTGSTRYVDMEFTQGMVMQNYYWMEGPMHGDQGRRVLVLHNGQQSQCSNCLRTGPTGCPAQGNGKLCIEMKTPRAKMIQYMNSLKIKVGYSSMKTKFLELHARNFPSLQGSDNITANMEESEDIENLFPSNPIEEKDKEIAKLKKEVSNLAEVPTELAALKETLTKVSAQLKIAKQDVQISRKKLEFAQKATEEKLIEDITNPEGYRADNIMIGVYSATLDEDQFNFDETQQDTVNRKSRKDLFLSMQKKLDLDNPKHSERFSEVKNLILEKVKTTKNSRLRSRSISSQGSAKRYRSKEECGNERSSTRPKTTNIPIKQS